MNTMQTTAPAFNSCPAELGDPQAALTTFLVALMHECDARGVSFDWAVADARQQYMDQMFKQQGAIE